MKAALVPVERIERQILLIRGQKVLLDSQLAELYGVATGNLVRAMKRNIDRFPEDFMLQLSCEELAILRCHLATSREWGGVPVRSACFHKPQTPTDRCQPDVQG